MDFNNFKELINKTRCTRRFKENETISKQDLIDIVDLARVTSSAKNMQPLKYIVINDEKTVKEMASRVKWAAHLTSWTQSESEQPSAFIVLVNDTSIDGFVMVDAGISLQTILLASRIKGYAGCALASIDKEFCKKEFNLAHGLEPVLGIAIGVEDEVLNVVDVKDNDTNYYRNDKDEHCVPKRALDEVLLGTY
ncbi:MAG: nitroreductase family protein [Campylobacteraceae bacterium]|nr:nitroreductase family protein [Campylobacteraceae bacterium]